MRWLDRHLRDKRFEIARPFVEPGDDVLDVGCADGEMFRQWDDLIGRGLGLDPDIVQPGTTGRHELRRGSFPGDAGDVRCDVVTMLAVLEHVRPDHQEAVVVRCAEITRPGGRLIVTVPSRRVDPILDVLETLRLIDGMHTDEHHGFEPDDTVRLFDRSPFELIHRNRFEFGLNHLFVFQRR